jgi:exodeoxyribonuclease V beta subunit
MSPNRATPDRQDAMQPSAGEDNIQSNDVGLTLPLAGVQLIEASAGTGKTFTLMTLLLRLLLERGVALTDVCAVTFTIAATQELRERLRRRLHLAERLLDAHDLDGLEGEALATAQVLQHARDAAGDARVRTRLAAARLQQDQAVVATIHGFCQRSLRELGFHAATLDDARIVEAVDEVWRAIAADLWRQAATADAPALLSLLGEAWGTPAALARDLPKLCEGARTQYPAADESEAAAALHAIRDEAIRRFDDATATRGLRSFDQLLERMWRASAEPAFARALSRRWPVLLVDEFQDTDPRQWDVFRRMFEAGERTQDDGHAPSPDAIAPAQALFLIGDPKQAIYRFRGGDLDTYLAARDYAQAHGSVATLGANYRSRDAVLRAIDGVFGTHPVPFLVEGIAYHPLRAAGGAGDGDLLVSGEIPAGLTFHWLPADLDAKDGVRNADDERTLMRDAAVAAIADLLAHATLHGAPLQPHQIAVLTQTNAQAADMQAALAQAGIAAALLSTQSVFAGDAAGELRVLLESLAAPADPSRMRAALATRLLGLDAAAIAALDDDAQTRASSTSEWAARIETAADTWRRRGPLPALLPFVSDAVPRWLGERGGARRLTDTLHLAELLQAESTRRHGPTDQLAWFAQTCGDATQAEERTLRLESDAGLVQIATLHKAKGLEYPVVVLPFAGYATTPPSSQGLSSDEFHDADGLARVWHRKDVLVARDADRIDAEVERERSAEALRQLYVGLTRAQYALHVVWSRNKTTDKTALRRLLHGDPPTAKKAAKLTYADMQARIEALAGASGGSIAVHPFDPSRPIARPPRSATASEAAPPPRTATRVLRAGPWLHSYSALHARSVRTGGVSSDSVRIIRGADDELAPGIDDSAPLSGTGFGNVVHAVLEAADFAPWRGSGGTPPDDTARTAIVDALQRHGLPADAPAIAQTARLVARALNVALPGGARLCDLPAARRVAEMEFHFRLAPTRLDALHAVLAEHGYPRAAPPSPLTLEGLMHGYIDLVYRDGAGAHHVLDYKTNRLPGYGGEALREAVRASDYDLQYLIYLVALQRWLRFRLGGRFDPRRDLGGAVYLFLRGIDDVGAPGTTPEGAREGAIAGDLFGRNGVHVDRPPQPLLDALDRLFDGAPP